MKVLKIGAVWCPGCLIMKPRWAQIEKEIPWLETEYFDYDENEDMLVAKYKITDSLPVFIFLDKEGKEIDRMVGTVTSKEIYQMIDKYKEL